MGKFIDTKYKDTVESLTGFQDTLINNSLYQFNDKSPTPVRYHNTNIDKSTLDPGSKLQQIEIGDNSPSRFNVIEGLMIYGLPKMELNLENGEFGLEAEPIVGEGYIMPNTIQPYPGDFFEIPYMYNGPWLFMVNEVQRDTLDTGSNVFKISFKLERHDDEIKKNIVDEYIALDVQQGTNIKTVVKKTNYIKAKELDDLSSKLKTYFTDLFFVDSVQTFIYKYLNESNMYDPFLIEFLIRNSILKDGSSKYIYVSQQMPLPATFAIDYDKTFYRAFELKDKTLLSNSVIASQADIINSMASIFHTRFEPYFALSYKSYLGHEISNIKQWIPIISEDLVSLIIDNNNPLLVLDHRYMYQSVFIKYFNNIDLDEGDIDNINSMKFTDAKEVFYMIPLLIFVVEYYTEKLLN